MRNWILYCILGGLVLFGILFIIALGYGGVISYNLSCAKWNSLPLTSAEIAIEAQERRDLLRSLSLAHADYMSVDVGSERSLREFSQPYQNLYSRQVLRVAISGNRATLTLGPANRKILCFQPLNPYPDIWAEIIDHSHGESASGACVFISYIDKQGHAVDDESGESEGRCCIDGL
jgi:hypothetical protein